MLIFLYDKLMLKSTQRRMKLPLKFVGYALIKADMFKYSNQTKNAFLLKTRGNRNCVVYGAVYHCDDFDIFQNVIDAHHLSMHSLYKRNHPKDLVHRKIVDAYLIKFNSLNEMSNLMYTEYAQVENVLAYFGNINHNKIAMLSKRNNRNRIISGMDKQHFRELFWEVENEKP